MSGTSENNITAGTRFCAVYGHPVQHSASPAMHNAALAVLGLDWRYLAFDVHPGQLLPALEGARVMKFIGLNLTVPHKLLAVKWVDVLDESAKTWGAVNTIRFESKNPAGEWRPIGERAPGDLGEIRAQGFNTDADAIIRSLKEDLSLEARGSRVLLLGAGGAGRVAALKLASEGVLRLHLVNRTLAKAAEVAREIQQLFPATRVSTGYPDESVDLILNATSLGLKAGDPMPLDEARYPISRAGAVYDMIYRPAETPLLQQARSQKRPAANGLGMLLYQGAKALEIWTGISAPVAVMREALGKNIYGHL